MTKAEVVSRISEQTTYKKEDISNILESFMEVVKDSMIEGNDIFLRGFGSFINKKRAKKLGRIVLTNTPVLIPEHYIPKFKPCREFKESIKKSKKVKLLKKSIVTA